MRVRFLHDAPLFEFPWPDRYTDLMIRLRIHDFIKYKILPWLNPIKYDEWGSPKVHPYSLTTRSLTREECVEMVGWLEANVRGQIAMGHCAYWTPLATVLEAHRSLHARYPDGGGRSTAPFCFSRKDEFLAFKALWG